MTFTKKRLRYTAFALAILPNLSFQKNIRLSSFHIPTIITEVQKCPIYRLSDDVVAFRAKFAVDADGSPFAYAPNGRGLDDIQHAFSKGKKRWVGILTNDDGKPVVQKSTDPAPGFFVSPTSMYDSSYRLSDPRRYVNAQTTPYIVISEFLMKKIGAKVGDIGYAFNPKTGKSCFAIFADVGPNEKVGEGSIALAAALGIENLSPRNGGLDDKDAIQYVVFPQSGRGNGRHISREEIDTIGAQEMAKMGGEWAVLSSF